MRNTRHPHARPPTKNPPSTRPGAGRTRPAPQGPTPGKAPGAPGAARATDTTDATDGSADATHPRLSRRMGELGLCSRREADQWITNGWVRVDGAVVTTLGTRVSPHARIEVDRRARVAQADRVTILVNKPIGHVSGQAEDGYPPAAALFTAANRWPGCRSARRFDPGQRDGLAPAGRLDIDSTGLLVLTQDGRIARQLIGVDSAIEKEYLVRVEGRLDDTGLARLRHGLVLDDHALRPARVEWLNRDQLRFVLTEGRKRQIRRMCELVGLRVVGLRRVRIGRVRLGELPLGRWRYLSASESF
ncbi:MAG: pseudouridine synthase [Lautropia sp.]